MLDLIATIIFVQLDDFARARLAQKTEDEMWLGRKNPRLKDRKLTLSEAGCLLGVFQASRTRDFKAFHHVHRHLLRSLFPNLPIYRRAVHWTAKAQGFLADFVESSATEPRRSTPTR